MKQSAGDGRTVHFQIGENTGHLEQVIKVGFSRITLLVLVGLNAEFVGLFQNIEIRRLGVLPH